MNTGVYGICLKDTTKLYVGSTGRSFKERWKDHLRVLRKGTHHSRHFQNAWNKYGEDAFEFVIFCRCPPEEVRYYEQIYIDALYPEFNRSPLAGSVKGIKRDEEAIVKMTSFQRSRAPKYLVRGEMLCAAEMAEKYNISINTIYARIYKGVIGDDLVKKRARGGEPNTGAKRLIHGRWLTVRQMSEQYGLSIGTIKGRIQRGQDGDALVVPLKGLSAA